MFSLRLVRHWQLALLLPNLGCGLELKVAPDSGHQQTFMGRNIVKSSAKLILLVPKKSFSNFALWSSSLAVENPPTPDFPSSPKGQQSTDSATRPGPSKRIAGLAICFGVVCTASADLELGKSVDLKPMRPLRCLP